MKFPHCAANRHVFDEGDVGVQLHINVFADVRVQDHVFAGGDVLLTDTFSLMLGIKFSPENVLGFRHGFA